MSFCTICGDRVPCNHFINLGCGTVAHMGCVSPDTGGTLIPDFKEQREVKGKNGLAWLLQHISRHPLTAYVLTDDPLGSNRVLLGCTTEKQAQEIAAGARRSGVTCVRVFTTDKALAVVAALSNFSYKEVDPHETYFNLYERLRHLLREDNALLNVVSGRKISDGNGNFSTPVRVWCYYTSTYRGETEPHCLEITSVLAKVSSLTKHGDSLIVDAPSDIRLAIRDAGVPLDAQPRTEEF